MGKRGRQYIKTRDSDSGDDKLKESLISWETEMMIWFDIFPPLLFENVAHYKYGGPLGPDF